MITTVLAFVFLLTMGKGNGLWSHAEEYLGQTYCDAEAFWNENEEKLVTFFLNYEVLTNEQKVQAWQLLTDYQTIYLGISSINLEVMELPENIAGQYCMRNDTTIKLSTQLYEKDFKLVLETICHEVYHAYEHVCVKSTDLSQVDTNLYVYKQIQDWKVNFENYQEFCVDDYAQNLKYSIQIVERDARAYAAEQAESLYRQIESSAERRGQGK